MNETEKAWLAGLLEGEGCFSETRKCPMIALHMTDEDVIVRAARIMGHSGKVGKVMRPGHKVVHVITVYGNLALEIMTNVAPMMGERRRRRISEVVRLANNRTGGPRPIKLDRNKAEQMRADYASGTTIFEIASIFDVSYDAARDAIKGRTWK